MKPIIPSGYYHKDIREYALSVINGERTRRTLSEIGADIDCSKQAIHAQVRGFIEKFKTLNPGWHIPENQQIGIGDRSMLNNDNAGQLVRAGGLCKMFSPPISERTVRNWQENRIIPFYKVGRFVFFNTGEVFNHIKKHYTTEAK
jgi:hypothetical protein